MPAASGGISPESGTTLQKRSWWESEIWGLWKAKIGGDGEENGNAKGEEGFSAGREDRKEAANKSTKGFLGDAKTHGYCF